MKLRIFIPAILVILLAAACAPPPQLLNDQYLKDTSLIDGEPCGPNCWRGIIPGETSWIDTLTIIEDEADLTNLQEPEVDQETGEVATTFQQEGGIACCLLYSEDGTTLDQMLLQLSPDIELGQVIEVHGEPTYLTGTEISEEQAAAALYYPDVPMIVYAFAEGAANGEISEGSEIFAVLYIRQQDMDDVLINSELYNWDGYAPYQDYFSGNPDIVPSGAESTDTEEQSTEESSD